MGSEKAEAIYKNAPAKLFIKKLSASKKGIPETKGGKYSDTLKFYCITFLYMIKFIPVVDSTNRLLRNLWITPLYVDSKPLVLRTTSLK